MMNRLSPRERVAIVAGAVVLSGLILWFVVFVPYFNAIDRLERRINAHRHNLVRVEKMVSQINNLHHQLANIGNRTVKKKALFSLIENLTEQTGVHDQLLSMRPQPASTQGKYRQQRVEIGLEKLSLAQLVKLLHAIEYRSGGVQVKSLRVKPRFEDRSLLDVHMVLMSLEKL